MYALIKNGRVEKYPYTLTDLRLDNRGVSWPKELTDELAASFGCFPVVETFVTFDEASQVAERGTPVLVEGRWLEQWVVRNKTADELIASQSSRLSAAKESRAEEVLAIKVTTQAGHTFDGDETAQTRMSRAVVAMGEGDTIPWVLSDNSVAIVGRAELQEALRLAGAAMAAIWVRPYQ